MVTLTLAELRTSHAYLDAEYAPKKEERREKALRSLFVSYFITTMVDAWCILLTSRIKKGIDIEIETSATCLVRGGGSWDTHGVFV